MIFTYCWSEPTLRTFTNTWSEPKFKIFTTSASEPRLRIFTEPMSETFLMQNGLESMQLYCCGCQSNVEAFLTTGQEIYPHRRDLFSLPFWKCPTCGNYVGCHHKTKNRTKPLGSIPTPELRRARNRVHIALDPLWRHWKIDRSSLYADIGQLIGREYHTADIRSVEEAERVIRFLKEVESNLYESQSKTPESL